MSKAVLWYHCLQMTHWYFIGYFLKFSGQKCNESWSLLGDYFGCGLKKLHRTLNSGQQTMIHLGWTASLRRGWNFQQWLSHQIWTSLTWINVKTNCLRRTWRSYEWEQTFLLLGPAEAAGGLLELVSVDFDHPEGTEHLGQVRRLVTGRRSEMVSPAFRGGERAKKNYFAIAHHAKRTQQYMMAAPMMATALPSFWMPSCPMLG